MVNSHFTLQDYTDHALRHKDDGSGFVLTQPKKKQIPVAKNICSRLFITLKLVSGLSTPLYEK